MKIKALLNLGTNDFPSTPFVAGEEYEVDQAFGQKILAQGLAIDVTPQPEPERTPTPEEEAKAIRLAEKTVATTQVEKPVPSVPLANFQSRKK